MSQFKEHTLTELLKLANDAKTMHDDLKEDIITISQTIDNLNVEINSKIDLLNFIEKNYVDIVEEMNNRDAIR